MSGAVPSLLHELLGPPDPALAWQEQGACTDEANIDLFLPSLDPSLSAGDRPRATAAALALCQGCPVLATCHQYAEDNDERFGIWGGVDRTQLHRTRRRTAHETRVASELAVHHTVVSLRRSRPRPHRDDNRPA